MGVSISTVFAWCWLLAGIITGSAALEDQINCIQPYSKNSHYWQYKGAPILLLGGTDNDNLFQTPHLKEQLTLLQQVGGNFIRNTMSSRDSGDVFPFKRLPDNRYDLSQWNPNYWERFENLLKWCEQRDIIIQLEVWDRFDYSQEFWDQSPYNPANTVSYNTQQSGLAEEYPEHPWLDLQPFFHSIPGMPKYQPSLDLVRNFQEAFVLKMLSYSLKFDNVLYCMDNETSTPRQWGLYWIQFIREQARAKGRQIYLTDMFDEFYKPQSCEVCQEVIKEPDVYTFMDISQINSRNFDQQHWDTLQWILTRVKKYPRPVNHTKIYGGGSTSWGSGTPEDGVERFFRNIIGGSASARFHRPWAGSGLSSRSQAAIRAVRIAEQRIKLWQVHVRQDLLADREPDEAYLASSNDETQHILYYTDGGQVKLELIEASQDFTLQWINIQSGTTEHTGTVQGGQHALIRAPTAGGWLALIYLD